MAFCILQARIANPRYRGYETDFDAATGSWRKSMAEPAEPAYGFLLLSENSLLPFTQCAVAAMLQKV
jgi:hypothetical protein